MRKKERCITRFMVRIKVLVKPGVKVSKIEKTSEGEYTVWVDAPAKENKANIRLLNILSEYLQVPVSSIRFVSGVKGRVKVLEIC